jgi:hypothetical protein
MIFDKYLFDVVRMVCDAECRTCGRRPSSGKNASVSPNTSNSGYNLVVDLGDRILKAVNEIPAETLT